MRRALHGRGTRTTNNIRRWCTAELLTTCSLLQVVKPQCYCAAVLLNTCQQRRGSQLQRTSGGKIIAQPAREVPARLSETKTSKRLIGARWRALTAGVIVDAEPALPAAGVIVSDRAIDTDCLVLAVQWQTGSDHPTCLGTPCSCHEAAGAIAAR